MFPPRADTNGIWDSCSQPPSTSESRTTSTSSSGVVALSPRPSPALGPSGTGRSQWTHPSESPSNRQDQALSSQSQLIDPVSFQSAYPIITQSLASPDAPLSRPHALAVANSETAMIHPMLQFNGGRIELDFSVSLACAHVWGSVTEPATLPPLPSLAVVSQMLPWPIVVQRSAVREWGDGG